jgi:hypothetical protein
VYSYTVVKLFVEIREHSLNAPILYEVRRKAHSIHGSQYLEMEPIAPLRMEAYVYINAESTNEVLRTLIEPKKNKGKQ